MPYAPLASVVVDQIASEAWANQVKANFDAGPNPLAQAVGDLVYASAVQTLARLPVGAAGALLGVSGGLPAWLTTIALAGGGLTIGTDCNLYRLQADVLKTDDSLYAGGGLASSHGLTGQIYLTHVSGTPTIYFGSAIDTILQRAGTNALSTPGALTVGGAFSAGAITGTFANGSVPLAALAAAPSARARRTTTLTVTASWTPVSYDAEDWDNAALHSAGTPTRFSAPVAGVYHAWATAAIQQGASNLNPILAIRDSAGNHLARQDGVPNATNSFAYVSVDCEVKLAVNDWVDVAVIVNGSGTATMLADGASSPCRAGLSYLGPG